MHQRLLRLAMGPRRAKRGLRRGASRGLGVVGPSASVIVSSGGRFLSDVCTLTPSNGCRSFTSPRPPPPTCASSAPCRGAASSPRPPCPVASPAGVGVSSVPASVPPGGVRIPPLCCGATDGRAALLPGRCRTAEEGRREEDGGRRPLLPPQFFAVYYQQQSKGDFF